MHFELIYKSFRFAFTTLLNNILLFLLPIVVMALDLVLLLFILSKISSSTVYYAVKVDYAVLAIFAIGVMAIISQVIIQIGLKLYSNQSASFSDYFDSKYIVKLLPFLVVVYFSSFAILPTGILSTFPVSGPLLYLLLLIFLPRWQFAPNVLVDQQKGIISSIKTSWSMTESYWFESFVFMIIFLAVNALSGPLIPFES